MLISEHVKQGMSHYRGRGGGIDRLRLNARALLRALDECDAGSCCSRCGANASTRWTRSIATWSSRRVTLAGNRTGRDGRPDCPLPFRLPLLLSLGTDLQGIWNPLLGWLRRLQSFGVRIARRDVEIHTAYPYLHGRRPAVMQHLHRVDQVTVRTSKTAAGAGRIVPLNATALETLKTWAARFPKRRPEHALFPSEQVGVASDERVVQATVRDPSVPIGSLKEAWETAKRRAGVQVRWHDLRHTACTRLLEAGVTLPIIARIFGWSASTTVRMAQRYGHISHATQREAMACLDGPRPKPMSSAGEELGTARFH